MALVTRFALVHVTVHFTDMLGIHLGFGMLVAIGACEVLVACCILMAGTAIVLVLRVIALLQREEPLVIEGRWLPRCLTVAGCTIRRESRVLVIGIGGFVVIRLVTTYAGARCSFVDVVLVTARTRCCFVFAF